MHMVPLLKGGGCFFLFLLLFFDVAYSSTVSHDFAVVSSNRKKKGVKTHYERFDESGE